MSLKIRMAFKLRDCQVSACELALLHQHRVLPRLNHSQEFMLSVQECQVDDAEERICELFSLAAVRGLESLRFLGRHPVGGSRGLMGGAA